MSIGGRKGGKENEKIELGGIFLGKKNGRRVFWENGNFFP